MLLRCLSHSHFNDTFRSALTSKLGLRDGWLAALSAVSARGVPAYVFSSGYGDVVAQVLLQGGLSAASVGGAQQQQQNGGEKFIFVC